MDCGETCPSPIATYSASSVGYFSSVATCAMASSDARRFSGRCCLRIAAFISSRPVSSASSRRSRLNHCLILFRARGLFTICSQSWDGAASRAFDVMTSTVSPVCSA